MPIPVSDPSAVLSHGLIRADDGSVWPDPATVLSGYSYGPTGTEYTGTATVTTPPDVSGVSAKFVERMRAMYERKWMWDQVSLYRYLEGPHTNDGPNAAYALVYEDVAAKLSGFQLDENAQAGDLVEGQGMVVLPILMYAQVTERDRLLVTKHVATDVPADRQIWLEVVSRPMPSVTGLKFRARLTTEEVL